MDRARCVEAPRCFFLQTEIPLGSKADADSSSRIVIQNDAGRIVVEIAGRQGFPPPRAAGRRVGFLSVDTRPPPPVRSAPTSKEWIDDDGWPAGRKLSEMRGLQFRTRAPTWGRRSVVKLRTLLLRRISGERDRTPPVVEGFCLRMLVFDSPIGLVTGREEVKRDLSFPFC